MDIIAEIRRRHLVSKESISSIARSLKTTRTTVRKHLKTEIEQVYQRQIQPSPKFGAFKALLADWLKTEAKSPRKQRRTAMRLYEGLDWSSVISRLSHPKLIGWSLGNMIAPCTKNVMRSKDYSADSRVFVEYSPDSTNWMSSSSHPSISPLSSRYLGSVNRL